VRSKVFELLFGAIPREHYVREMALRSHLALHTIQDELRKLRALELVTSRSKGSYRYYQANRRHPLYRPISQIVALSGQSPRAHLADLQRKTKKIQRPRRAHLRVPYGPINWGILQKKS
jgi:predicted transcriptional regulator